MLVPALQWLREAIEGQPMPPLVAVFGDEPYLKRCVLARFLKWTLPGEDAEMGLSRFLGTNKEMKLADVLDELRTLPFLAPRRVVLVEDADEFITRFRGELETYATKPSKSGILVFLAKTWTSTTKLAQKVNQVGLSIDCRAPKEGELYPFLINHARDHFQLKLDPASARLMVELVGPELGLLMSELDKLAVYVGKSKVISREDILRMVDSGRVGEIWTAIEAATTGDMKTAMTILDQLLDANEPPIKILAAITSNLGKIYHAGMLRVMRRSPEQAGEEAGISSMFLQKLLKQHAHLGPSRVAKLPLWLLEADLDLKGNSQLPAQIILERLFIRLALPRSD